MDVPYHSSGALGRAHYAIVRKVETADSVHLADQHIILEIESVKSQLAQSNLDNAKTKECLLILLYCSLACSPGVLPSTAFTFAFFPAINLAERGRTLDDKRIGYRFCIELMPLEHEAGLMLDLESSEIPYICLALDSLLALPTEHMIAAVQDRLNQLIDHDSPLVRRRTLLAFRSLATQNPMVLERIKNVIVLSLHDEDESVSHATLALLNQSDIVDRDKCQVAVREILSNKLGTLDLKNPASVAKVIPYLKIVSPIDDYVPLLFKILRQVAKTYDSTSKALILDVFRILSSLDPEAYCKAEREQKTSTVRAIRRFLKSSEPDDVYVFFAALESISVNAWAGTDSSHPAVLAEDEFQRILEFLNHSDPIIRLKVRMNFSAFSLRLKPVQVMKIIRRVDPNVLDSHISLLREVMKPPTAGIDLSCSLLALEALRVRYSDDGSKYAETTLALLQDISQASSSNRVFEPIVDCILRDENLTSRQEFGRSFARRFLSSLSDTSLDTGGTTLVIASALAVEFAPVLGLATSGNLLSAFGTRLATCKASVQEPCILAMIRLCAEVDIVPPAITESVTKLMETATRSVRKYCKLFLEFSQQKHALHEVLLSCKSSSLPDFLIALMSRKSAELVRSGPSSRTPSRLKFASGDISSAVDSQAARLDLISLESPFHGDPPDVEFGKSWNSLNPSSETRGWSLIPLDEIKHKLHDLPDHEVKLVSAQFPPFPGEHKIIITSSVSAGVAAVRLRQEEDDTSLRISQTNIGIAGTFYELPGIDASALDLDDQRERIAKNDRAKIDIHTLLSWVDQTHLENIFILHWMPALVNYIPELSYCKHLTSGKNKTYTTELKDGIVDFLAQIGQEDGDYHRRLVLNSSWVHQVNLYAYFQSLASTKSLPPFEGIEAHARGLHVHLSYSSSRAIYHALGDITRDSPCSQSVPFSTHGQRPLSSASSTPTRYIAPTTAIDKSDQVLAKSIAFMRDAIHSQEFHFAATEGDVGRVY
ncbi:hypothetical protein CVT24_004131 [Panaeolus cyanescens]|uniref:Uncharacterized protein n=1 Tax=Panaeolus cyanescens TaxID=181874 RepID=A0A409Y5Z5_9AGAR|nr:hypothetical protein CVT24_004131 [Panaeolus cyanescens]